MALLFARLQADVPLKMRRGAWYRVIQLTDLQAVIEINHRKVGVLRAWLEIQQRRLHELSGAGAAAEESNGAHTRVRAVPAGVRDQLARRERRQTRRVTAVTS